jgi:hypothetical protein
MELDYKLDLSRYDRATVEQLLADQVITKKEYEEWARKACLSPTEGSA